MAAYDHLRYCDEVEAEVDRFALALQVADPGQPVPTCPGWTVRDLADHCGSTLLWGAALVDRLSQERLSGRNLELTPPAGRSGDPAWIRECGVQLLASLRAAGPDTPMWAWGADQHVRFWSRRMLYETLVHRVDICLAAGLQYEVDADLAADCVDEFLVNLRRAAEFSPRVLELRGEGETIVLRCTDTPDAWAATLLPDGFTISRELPPTPTVVVAGAALPMMLVVNRRAALANQPIDVTGDRGVLDFWLERSALE